MTGWGVAAMLGIVLASFGSLVLGIKAGWDTAYEKAWGLILHLIERWEPALDPKLIAVAKELKRRGAP